MGRSRQSGMGRTIATDTAHIFAGRLSPYRRIDLAGYARLTLAVLLAVVVAGCTGVPVSTDYNTGYRFHEASSYAWLERKDNSGVAGSLADNDLVEARVRRAVDDQLKARGLAPAGSVEQADLLVTYYIGQEDKLDVRSFRSNFGYYPCWHCYGPYGGAGWGYDNDVWVTEYTEGTLVIDIIDAETRKLVWHGIAERRLPVFTDPHQRDAYVRETVTAILARFPPGNAAAP